MKLLLVTGMSGAGKSVVLKTLEDCGFEAIDNIPLALLLPLAAADAGRNLAVGSDIRSRDFSIKHMIEAIEGLKKIPSVDFTMLFLDCDDEVLRRRFTETRRRHPLALDRTVPDGIRHERQMIWRLRELADAVIDTTDTEAAELRQAVMSRFAPQGSDLSLVVTSFSFKRGVPREADLLFDVRFLSNPHYEPDLKELNGTDAKVAKYIEADRDFDGFFDRLTSLLLPLLPRYVEEGKHYLTVALGCTGGKHRSVHVAQKLGGFLQSKGYNVTVRHRDL